MSVDIAYKSIFKVIFVLIAIWFLYQILDILAVVFFGIIISSAVAPLIDKLQQEGIPRIGGALLIYLAIIVIFSFIGYIIVPPMISQIAKLSAQLPSLLAEYTGSLSLPEDIFREFSQTLRGIPSNIIAWLIGLLGGIGNVFFVFVISFYLSVEDQGIKRFLQTALPDHRYRYVSELIERSQRTLAQWLKAQLILMFFVGLMTYIALLILGIPYALALATLAGLLEIVPFAGPVIAAIPPIIFAFEQSPFIALLTFIIFIVIQQVESQILTPFVMKRTFELNPVLVLLAIFVGAKLGGIVGILASVPLLALFIEFSKDYYQKEPR